MTSRGSSQVKLLNGTVWPESFLTRPEISECPLESDLYAQSRVTQTEPRGLGGDSKVVADIRSLFVS